MQPVTEVEIPIATQELNVNSPPCRSENSKFQKILSKVWKVTKYILKTLAGIAFLIASPAFTILGYAFGFLDPEHAKPIIDRIKEVWQKLPWACVIAAGTATFIALPVTIAVSSFLYGTYLGLSTANYVHNLPDERQNQNYRNQEDVIVNRNAPNPASLETIISV